MFRGVNSLNLDAKGRMAMPSKYRERLLGQSDGQLVVTVDLSDPCLLLYPLPEWEDIERKLVRLGNLDPRARRLQRLLIGHATEVELDSNSRILLPPPLREFAHLDKRIALLDGNPLDLTTNEFTALALLARNAGKVLNRDQILQELRGMDCDAFNRSVDIAVSRLRQKLKDNPKSPVFIKTIWGSGYVFIADITEAVIS